MQLNNTYTYHLPNLDMLPSNHSEHSPLDDPARRRLPVLLRRSWFSLNQSFRRRILFTGVTPDQFTVLRTLMEADERGLTQRKIAEIISSDPNTIASLLERMEASGLVKRQKHESDRRAHRIVVLPHGKKVYKQIREVALDLQSEILANLPEEQRELFLENLARVADACHQSAAKCSRGRSRGNSKEAKSGTVKAK
ncbi:MAG: MarR family winged helix-turn-helix transcriptional regulator [Verrucomicrobiota bacterium]